ncbi:MAG: tetratricopeptide repeat protein [Pseudomonadota bacterium]
MQISNAGPSRATFRKKASQRGTVARVLTLAIMTGTLGVFGLVGTPSSAIAFDPNSTFKADDKPQTILRYGFDALQRGDMAGALGAFRFGAQRNDLAAQWKLARMFQVGEGVHKDPVTAFELFDKIADRYADRAPEGRDRAFVSHALVSLGRYHRKGIKQSKLPSNPRLAEFYFYQAAALYHDAAAQYELGRLYQSDLLGQSQPRLAARWYGLAARKGHSGAQGRLGEMLFYGQGVRRNPVKGLVYLSKATAKRTRKGIRKFRRMRRQAFNDASQAQRAAANKMLQRLGLLDTANEQTGKNAFAFQEIPKVLED